MGRCQSCQVIVVASTALAMVNLDANWAKASANPSQTLLCRRLVGKVLNAKCALYFEGCLEPENDHGCGLHADKPLLARRYK